MNFDLSNVISQAQQQSSKGEGSTDYKYRLVYPSTGTLKVKLLFNPKSGLVSRQIFRHKVSDANHTCLATYGQECPLCKVIENIENAKGVDLWRVKRKSRGISFAQYVGSDHYDWQGKEPQVGDIILLMYPWSVYSRINKLIADAGDKAKDIVAENNGVIVKITNSNQDNKIEYTTDLGFEGMSPITFKSASDDVAFEKLLNELDDLNEQVCPSKPTQDMITEINNAVETLNREYLSDLFINNPNKDNASSFVGVVNQSSIPQVNNQQVIDPSITSQINNQQINNLSSIPQVNNQQVNNNPPCMGKHINGSEQCAKCLQEANCLMMSSK